MYFPSGPDRAIYIIAGRAQRTLLRPLGSSRGTYMTGHQALLHHPDAVPVKSERLLTGSMWWKAKVMMSPARGHVDHRGLT